MTGPERVLSWSSEVSVPIPSGWPRNTCFVIVSLQLELSLFIWKNTVLVTLTISILRVFFKGLAEFPITQMSALTMTCFEPPAFVPLRAWKLNTWHYDTSGSEHYVFLLKCGFGAWMWWLLIFCLKKKVFLSSRLFPVWSKAWGAGLGYDSLKDKPYNTAIIHLVIPKVGCRFYVQTDKLKEN